jgi:hypothetical protein
MTIAAFYRSEIKAALPLRDGVKFDGVLGEIDAAIQKFYADWGEHRTNEVESLNEHTICNPFKAHPSTRKRGRSVSAGRAPKDEQQRYIEAVLLIYDHATGQRIGLSNPSDSKSLLKKHPRQKRPHPFLLACLRAAQICAGPNDYPGYPTGIIRKAIKKMYPNAKRGRPRTKKRT